jgi:hypothetical protein
MGSTTGLYGNFGIIFVLLYMIISAIATEQGL